MTEQEWLACTDPQPMLGFIWQPAYDRRLRRFVLACCQELWASSPDEALRAGFQIFESVVPNGPLSPLPTLIRVPLGEVVIDCRASEPFSPLRLTNGDQVLDIESSSDIWFFLKFLGCYSPLNLRPDRYASFFSASGLPRARQATILRDVVFPSYRSVNCPREWLAWNGATVHQLADRIDREGVYYDLPILADALEDAGCDNVAILTHLRGGGGHVRGCWAIDSILGKA